MNILPEENIKRLAQVFPGIMHFFHNIAGQVSKFGEFSLAQYRVLMFLFSRDHLTINHLKHELGTAQSTASGMIDRLVQQGLVRKEKNPNDLRQTVLVLTPKAKSIIRQRMDSMTEVYQKILSDFSEEEQVVLIDALEQIFQVLQTKQSMHKGSTHG